MLNRFAHTLTQKFPSSSVKYFKSKDFSTDEGWVSRRSAQVMPTEFKIL